MVGQAGATIGQTTNFAIDLIYILQQASWCQLLQPATANKRSTNNPTEKPVGIVTWHTLPVTDAETDSGKPKNSLDIWMLFILYWIIFFKLYWC